MVRFLKAVTLLAGAGYVAWRFMQGHAPETLKRVPEQMPESLKSVPERMPESLKSERSSRSTSSNGSPGSSEMTKAQLYERAKELGIEGRSKMSKQDLERAIRDAG